MHFKVTVRALSVLGMLGVLREYHVSDVIWASSISGRSWTCLSGLLSLVCYRFSVTEVRHRVSGYLQQLVISYDSMNRPTDMIATT